MIKQMKEAQVKIGRSQGLCISRQIMQKLLHSLCAATIQKYSPLSEESLTLIGHLRDKKSGLKCYGELIPCTYHVNQFGTKFFTVDRWWIFQGGIYHNQCITSCFPMFFFSLYIQRQDDAQKILGLLSNCIVSLNTNKLKQQRSKTYVYIF